MKQPLILLFLGLFGFFGRVHFAGAQTYPQLEKVLSKTFPEKSNEDGRWVFYAKNAKIEKIDKPIVKARHPNLDFYTVGMVNYLGYHINQSTCLVLYDSLKSKAVLVPPIWYSGISQKAIDLCLHEQFESKDALLDYLQALHELIELGSGYRFVQTSYTDSLIKYDLVYFRGDAYTTGGNGIRNTVQYTQDGIWRKILVAHKDFKVLRYLEINPKMDGEKGGE
jgi:hypothetical protein